MISIELGHYLALGGVIFLLGVVGIFLNRKNVIVILMSVELILLAVNINLVAFSIYSNDITGQIFTFFILLEEWPIRTLIFDFAQLIVFLFLFWSLPWMIKPILFII